MKQANFKDIELVNKYSATVEYEDMAKVNDVRTSHLTDDMVAENTLTLQMCKQYWQSLSEFRSRRARVRKYMRGDQWHELTTNDAGETVTEETFIKERGKIPFKQNIIRQLARAILGYYLSNPTKVIVSARKKEDSKIAEMLTNTLHTIHDVNKTKRIDTRNLEEFLISGASIGKSGYTYRKEINKEDVFLQNINPNRIFYNSDVADPRLIDLRLIGEVNDLPLDQLISSFARNEEDAEKIKGWYSYVTPKNMAIRGEGHSPDLIDGLAFDLPSSSDLARVIEVWELTSDWRMYVHDRLYGTYEIMDVTKEELDAENQARIEMIQSQGVQLIPEKHLIEYERKYEQFWTVKFLTPYGQCLYQSETVYEHESHPYTMILYPLLDGEVWGLLEDVIDQQRYINRLISLIDFIMGSAAKGVLLVPEDAIPDDYTLDDFADEWTKMDGVIKFKSKPGVPLPQQVSANLTNIGAYDMLAMQMKLVNEIAGVNGALQGHTAKSGTPSSLYAQEAMNSATNIKDVLETFSGYKKDRDTKALKTAMQFYDDNRLLKSSGSVYSNETSYYDPESIKDFEFDLVVSEGMDTPVFNQIIGEQLFNLLQMGAIDTEIYLQHSPMPFAQNILESLQQRKQQLQQGQNPGAIPPELMQQAVGQANPQVMQMLDQMLAGGK